MSSSQLNECYLFFGVSGAGKSATINQLCRAEKCKLGDGATSETQNCKLVHVDNQCSLFHGKSLLDMQGYNDTRPDENQGKIFEMTKLYFLGSRIEKVKCIIFVINMADAKTNFYLRFIAFLKQLFSEEQVTNNMIALLTKGDKLTPSEKENKLANIKANLVDIENRQGYKMETVEWSNQQPLPGQEEKLSAAISKLQGFDPKAALQAEAKKIDDAVAKLYEAKENINIVKHAAKMELKEFKVTREVEENVPIQCDEVVENIIPAEKETSTMKVEKTVHFQGQFGPGGESVGGSLYRGIARVGGILGTNYAVMAFAGRDTKTQTNVVEFTDKVLSVTFDKTADDIFLLDKLDYQIKADNPKSVIVTAVFSWGGGVVLTWDFDVKVTATIEHETLVKEAYKKKIVIPKQRIEKVKKTVTDIDKRLVPIADAYEEKLYKRTKEEIRKSIIDDQILKMT